MFESLIPPDWALRVQQLAPEEFWIGVTVLIVLALAAFYAIFRFVHRYHIIEGTPTSKVRSAAQGYVELDGIGYLLPGTPIVAPLSGMTCTWYHYKVEEKTESGNDRRERWRTLRQETSDDLFLLKDETGDCVIDPDGADVTPSISEVWYGDTPMWNGSMLRRSSGRFRFTEKRMHPGDGLYAIGQFRTVGGSQELPNTHEEVRELLAEWKRDQVALHARFDRNNDGVLSVDEWEEVRKAAWKDVLAAQAQRARGPAHNIMTRPDDGRRPYILSALPQEMLARRYRRYAALSVAVFLLAGSVATWLLTARFGG